MIIVNGAEGQLGRELCRLFGDQCLGLSRRRMDIRDPKSVTSVFQSVRPRVVINCAAYTAVDLAETNSESCRAINCTGVENLATAAAENDALLVQVSTDYVFGDTKASDGPIDEQRPASPRGIYATTKWEGELKASQCPRHLIVRTCGLFGVTPKKANFVEAMLRLGNERESLGVVNDQYCNPTSTKVVAIAIRRLIETNENGVFHVVSSPGMSWFEFADEIFRQSGLSTRLDPITTEQYGAAAPRPRYSVLDTSKYVRVTGERLPTIADDLAEYLVQRETQDR